MSWSKKEAVQPGQAPPPAVLSQHASLEQAWPQSQSANSITEEKLTAAKASLSSLSSSSSADSTVYVTRY